jgi:pyridoxine/pyridoxamine 5'-phosphate oxidase
MKRFSSLNDVLERVWNRLEAAAEDPGHSLRALTFGTVQETAPHLRTVILREADAETRRLSFHTDRRSQKVEDLRTRDRVAWLG